MERRISSLVDRGVRSLYGFDPVKRAIRRTGTDERFRRWYSSLYFTLPGADQCTVTCRDAQTQFFVESLSELTITKSILLTERPVLEDVLTYIREDDVFFDVGAHLGVYTCLVGDLLSEGRVVAFEPHADNADRLEGNVDLNGTNATVYRCALSDTRGAARFAAVDGEAIAQTGNQDHAIVTDDGDGGEQVTVETGNALVEREGIPVPNVIKIDVEGAELKVLQGFDELLDHNECRLVYCEVHLLGGGPHSVQEHGGTPSEIHEFLETFDYDLTIIYEREHGYFVRAKRG